MPQVHTRTKSTRGRAEFPCRVCSDPIVAGEQFYTWKKRVGGTSYMHTKHGFPKPSMLSNRKTAIIEDAIREIDTSSAQSLEDLQGMLENIADEAESVGQEYADGVQNMPENLQEGETAQMMQEVADELEQWAQELRDFDPGENVPEEDEFSEEDDPAQAFEDATKEYLDTIRSAADDLLGQMPEYQG